MLSWVAVNFILVIYSNAPQLTYFLIGLLAMARRVIWIRSVSLSVKKFSRNWLFIFFWNSTWCPFGVVYYKARFCPQNGENRPSPGFFEKVQFFFSVLYFFINLVYNEILYYCNSCMLEEISYLGKSWFLIYGPKCSWPIILQDFSINRRPLIYAASHKEINEINCFLVCPYNSFLKNG